MTFLSGRFLQKTNKRILLYYYETSGRLVFVRFLEEIEDTNKSFRNYLTFSDYQFCLIKENYNFLFIQSDTLWKYCLLYLKEKLRVDYHRKDYHSYHGTFHTIFKNSRLICARELLENVGLHELPRESLSVRASPFRRETPLSIHGDPYMVLVSDIKLIRTDTTLWS